ncbi:cob(I)yrinic acid a,c-diamide adenosyltransferase [Magnetospirillum sp. UT-4]|uniref:cob(I)yrinic acid a,c-diamide adenosyltransferase n=1 Tax=Magnetospirillum sp. UT-4 TaxID=2681467 RepID=UPI00137F2945|nr:cob(I)yrinic acid a,c-diamide adenosyltransferase [Magnetospirillum sp. UT-4]CAA7621633.1 Cob(I)yrinic acid a,c-diamide adenosyltransferase [Magnetospirillum sp. UT-4]
MVTLTRIYTRGGDKGQTSLGDGTRVGKHALRVEAYGTVDEANAVIGLARLDTAAEPQADAMLARIQNDLFDLGADLCNPAAEGEAPGQALRMVQPQVDRLEAEIDAMNQSLAPLTSFILPGGSPASARLHLARTVVRRAERLMVALAEAEPVGPAAIAYVNRLSDHLFVLARRMNGNGAADVLWTPGANRG